jgi:5'-3' exonuclease
MISLIDGDIVAYRCAASCEDESEAVAIRTTTTYLLDVLLDLTSALESFDVDAELTDNRVFLSGKGNFRYGISSDYKANRKGLPKPRHLNAIRQHLIDKYDATVSDNQEADDDIAIAATEYYLKSVIVSTDKDFKQVPGYLYDPVKKKLSFVREYDAALAFFTQVLTGDRVDNIKGVKGIGPVKAERLLNDCDTGGAMLKVCREAYGDDSELILNATLLYLKRYQDDVWSMERYNAS